MKAEKSISLSIWLTQPETLCNEDILLFLLHHEAPLLPEGKHCGEDGELLDVGVDVVEPELVHGQEGARPSNSCAAVHQDCSWE